MFDFLDKLSDPWKNVTASSIGLAAVVIAIYGKAIGGSDIPQWARIGLFAVGLAILMTGFVLTWSFAWDATDPKNKKLKLGPKAVAGVLNIVAGLLVVAVAIGAMALNWDQEGDSNTRADFTKSFGGYVDALNDDNADSLFAAQMGVFANCNAEHEDDTDASKDDAPDADTVLIQEVCRQLLEAKGEMERSSAVPILAQLTQPTPAASGPTSTPIPKATP